MANGRIMKMGKESESQAGTSDDSIKSPQLVNTDGRVSESLSIADTSTATTQRDLQKTLPSVALEALRFKAGIVAGALADFQMAGGTIVIEPISYTLPSGSYKALKILVAVKEKSLVAVETADGLTFDVEEANHA